MARPESRWMPLDWPDYWADTGHLTAAEHGAYLNLIGRYWRDGGLPNLETMLQRLSTMSVKEWRASKDTILAFFGRNGDRLTHKRIDRELERSRTVYEKRLSAARSTNAKRSADRDVKLTDTGTPLPPHSPDGEIQNPSGSGAQRPKSPKGTRLANDWQPSEEDREFARKLNLTDNEIAHFAEQFRRWWTGPDAKRPVKKDWNRAWCNWLDRGAAEVIGRRARTGKSGGNRPQPGSIVDVVNRLKAESGGPNAIPERSGFGVRHDGVHAAEHAGNDAPEGFGDDPEIIDSADAERMFRDARGIETADDRATGAVGGPGSPTETLRPQTPGLPGGRGETCAENPIEVIEVVAGLGRAVGTAGPARKAPPADDESHLDIPDFLRRTNLTMAG